MGSPLRTSECPPVPLPVVLTHDPLVSFGIQANSNGNVGQNWFAGRVWRWDYPKGTLELLSKDWRDKDHGHIVPISFKIAADGTRENSFPRLLIEVAVETIPVLLDTGATTVLSLDALKQVGGSNRIQATSMMSASRIAEWRRTHPGWKVAENAQTGTGSCMIEVPDVRIAGWQVGPVWFTERADQNFLRDISADMSSQVEGAVGGNAFRSLRMTIDYPQAIVLFDRSFAREKELRRPVTIHEEGR